MLITLLYLLPVVDFAVLATRVVEGQNGELCRIASAEDLGNYEAGREIHSRIADSVGEIELVKPLQDLSRERGAATDGVQHRLYFVINSIVRYVRQEETKKGRLHLRERVV